MPSVVSPLMSEYTEGVAGRPSTVGDLPVNRVCSCSQHTTTRSANTLVGTLRCADRIGS